MEGEHQMEKELPHVQDLPMARKVIFIHLLRGHQQIILVFSILPLIIYLLELQ